MALKNGNKQARGGKRKGAGRKPKTFTQLKRRIESERTEDAEYAFALFASVMRDSEQPVELRLDCGREVMNRVLGKPREQHELTGKDGGPIATKNVSELTDDERIARLAAIFERARARRSGQSVGGADKT